MANCRECNKEFTTLRALHTHFKAHKLFVSEYYHKHFPRYDKLDGSIIKFKDYDQYFEDDFNSRNNFKTWIKQQEKPVAQEYCKNLLIHRKDKKDLIYAPTQVELRSLGLPPVQYYNELFGSYYDLCKKLGFKNRFEMPILESLLGETGVELTFADIEDFPILVDTREQNKLNLQHSTEITTLNFGDYTYEGSKVCIERKSLPDFIGTMGKQVQRFENEVERAAMAASYLVVLIEQPLHQAIVFNTLPICHTTKATPEYIFHNVRNLLQKYGNLQFLFVSNRTESARVLKKVLQLGEICTKVDLQLTYDSKLL